MLVKVWHIANTKVLNKRTQALNRTTDEDDDASIEVLQILSDDVLEIATNVGCSVSAVLNMLSLTLAAYCVCRLYRLRDNPWSCFSRRKSPLRRP